MKTSLLLIPAFLVFLLLAAFPQEKANNKTASFVANATVGECWDEADFRGYCLARTIVFGTDQDTSSAQGSFKFVASEGSVQIAQVPLCRNLKKGDHVKVSITIEKVTP